ncbi:MAG TPA: hypothetical protein VGL02_03565, partial [Streptomyces sp.]
PPDSMPGTGRVKPADPGPDSFDGCSLSFDESADKSRSTYVSIHLYSQIISVDGIKPTQVDGRPIYFKKDEKSCYAAFKIPVAPTYLITTSSERLSGDSCETPREAMSVILKEIAEGTAERFPDTPGSAVYLDLCREIGTPTSPEGKPADRLDVSGLHACHWTIDGTGSYTVELRGGSDQDLTTEGQRPAEVAGTTVYEQPSRESAETQSCVTTWTHRKVDSYYTEEFSLVFIPTPQPADTTGICPAAEKFVGSVVSRLPPVK